MDGKRSFHDIYERFQPGVLRFLSRLVGEEEAEDVAQEFLLRVDRRLEGLMSQIPDEQASLERYLIGKAGPEGGGGQDG